MKRDVVIKGSVDRNIYFDFHSTMYLILCVDDII